jgi:nanoRNase/pAp phosphatase (c-di-AMP/oligoRNAs hydrolase)
MSESESTEVTRERVLERIREDSRFVLAAHERPDGDALGSLVGMQGLLSALGKDSVMFIASEDLPLPLEYRFFALEGLIQTPPTDIAERTVVFLDCGNIDRNSASVLHDGKHLLNIDHRCARRLVHGGDRLGSDARFGGGTDASGGAGAICRADHRYRALHVREHRSARTRDGGRSDRGGR